MARQQSESDKYESSRNCCCVQLETDLTFHDFHSEKKFDGDTGPSASEEEAAAAPSHQKGFFGRKDVKRDDFYESVVHKKSKWFVPRQNVDCACRRKYPPVV